MTNATNDLIVRGLDVDAETRCAHWHSPLDIVAIKFKCCGEWYACYDCHMELADHDAVPWPPGERDDPAIRCGSCRGNLTSSEYLACDSRCTRCGAEFNPGCAKHYDLYFQKQGPRI